MSFTQCAGGSTPIGREGKEFAALLHRLRERSGIDFSAYKSATIARRLAGRMSATDRGLSRAQIVTQLDASLKRLGTDYIDLYQCHRFDEETPLDETMEALTAAVRQGKARYIGFSEWPLDKIEAEKSQLAVSYKPMHPKMVQIESDRLVVEPAAELVRDHLDVGFDVASAAAVEVTGRRVMDRVVVAPAPTAMTSLGLMNFSVAAAIDSRSATMSLCRSVREGSVPKGRTAPRRGVSVVFAPPA